MKQLILLSLLITFLIQSDTFAQNKIIDELQKYISDAEYNKANDLIASHQASTNEENVLIKNLHAEILIRQGQLDQAGTLLQQIRELTPLLANPDRLEAITYTNIGFLQLNLGRPDLATDNLQLAIDIFEKSGAGTNADAARALSFLGVVYFSTGKYNQALSHQERSLEIRKNIFGDLHESVAASYNDLGLVYSQVNPDQALYYYELALGIYKNIYADDNPRIAQANTNIGVIYSKLELYGDAIINFEAALNTWNKIYTNAHPNKAFVLSNLGRTNNSMGNRVAALEYYQQALEIYKSTYGSKHPDIAQTYNNIASLKMSNQKWEEAIIDLQSAIIANVPTFENKDTNVNPAIDQFYNGNALLYSLLYKANAFEANHYNKTMRFSDLEKALGSLQSCDTLIEKLRRQSSNENDKLAIGAIASEVYEVGVRLSKAMSEITWKSKIYREQSFYFAEKSKSAVLLDAISESEAKSFANIPEELIEEEKSLKATIAFCAQRLAEKPDEAEEKALREAYFDLNRDYEAFVRKLESEYPDYFNLKFNTVAPSVPLIQEKLGSDKALISYFVAEKEQRLYIYLVTNKKFYIESKPIDANFERYLVGFRNSIFYQNKEIYLLTAHDLHQLLIPKKIPANVKELVIIPTGRLGTIPFEALVSKKIIDTDVSFKEFPYLVNRFSITYEFASTLLLQEKKFKELSGANVLLCAPVTFTANPFLPQLPGTEAEVKRIEELFNQNQYTSNSLKFDEASEDRLKSKDLKQYRLLHFATHGIVDEVNPELSRIFLNADPSSGEDGNLFSGEIYNLELDAELVVLSACQTGLGKVSKGEGVIGLSRALVYAGARKLIVSYWSVSDQSTAELMMGFYEYIIKNKNLNESSEPLREAKLDLIKGGDFADPYFWAPFILIGF